MASALATASSTAMELHDYILRMGMMHEDAASEFVALFEQSLLKKHYHGILAADSKQDLSFLQDFDSPELIDWSAVQPPKSLHPDPAAAARARSSSHGADMTADESEAPSSSSSSSSASAAQRSLLLQRQALRRCPSDTSLRTELLRKVAVVKLNGGLGSRMGCWGPKSALEVREGLTFLDLTVRQVEWLNAAYDADVPLVLMNSFQTHDDTVRVLGKYARHDITVHCVIQSCFPRLDVATLLPVADAAFSEDNRGLWYPPGHGDVWRTLSRSGMLAELIREGREWLFVSNVDNLGATVDLRILHALAAGELEAEGCDFAMEVTPKTKQDQQGGVFVDYKGGPMLVEAGQAPQAQRAELESLRHFNKHNTNNLWASAKQVQALVEGGRIRTQVLLHRRETEGLQMLQLETAAGAAMRCFNRAVGVEVDRSRFLPVKSTSDLLAVQSNLFEIRHGALLPSPARVSPAPPVVRLGPEFTRLRDFAVRFQAGLPDVVELDHLTVSGDVVFGKGVVLRGTVVIVATEGNRIDVPDGAVLENKVVTGGLRVLDN